MNLVQERFAGSDKMYHRTFNSVMHPLNETWSANVLKMTHNPNQGIDLISPDKNVEVKFTLQLLNEYKHKSWRVLDHELAWGKNGKTAYWALGFYTLTEEIANINVKTPQALERKVIERELFIVNWGWMDQYPRFHHIGKTKNSEWDQWLRFPKYKDIPKTEKTYTVKGGLIHLTNGVKLNLFQINK